MKNVNVLLNGKVVDLDPTQKYHIRVELEDGSPVWVKRDMLILDKADLPDVPEYVILDAYALRRYIKYFNDEATSNYFKGGILTMSEETRAWFNNCYENRMKFFKIMGSD